MHDWSYVLAGYGITGAAIAVYRLELARRTRRAHRVVAALTGRTTTGGRSRS